MAIQIRALLWRGLPVLAVYALVLQAFLAGAAPASAFDPAQSPLCAEMAAGGRLPAPGHPAGHTPDCLCVAACAMPHAALAIAPAPAAALPKRLAVAAPRSGVADERSPARRRVASASARGPPRV